MRGLIFCMLVTITACSKFSEAPDNKKVTRLVDTPCSIRMGFDPYAPFQYTDAQGRARGVDIELVEAMAALAHCHVSFVDRDANFNEIVADLIHGKVDLMADMTKTSDREQYALFSNPIRLEQFSLFIQSGASGRWKIKSFDDVVKIHHLRIGITSGYYYGDIVEELRNDANGKERFLEAESSSENFVNLLNGAVDIVLEDPYVADLLIQREKWQARVYRLGFQLPGSIVYLMFSRASVSEQTVSRFNDALEILRANGLYQTILERYQDRSLDALSVKN